MPRNVGMVLRAHRGFRHRGGRIGATALAGSPTTGDCPSALWISRSARARLPPRPDPARAARARLRRSTRAVLHHFQDGDRSCSSTRGATLPALLRKGETFHCDRGWLHHETIIGQPTAPGCGPPRHALSRHPPTLASTCSTCPGAPRSSIRRTCHGPLLGRHLSGARVLEAGMGSGP